MNCGGLHGISYADECGYMKAWAILMLAGVFEIAFAVSLAGSRAFTELGWSVSAALFFFLTMYMLSVALRWIEVSVGYAVWVGVGCVGAAVFGDIIFDQRLSGAQFFWLLIIIGGVIWLKLAER